MMLVLDKPSVHCVQPEATLLADSLAMHDLRQHR